MKTLEIFGDSITRGLGASDFSKSWVGLCTPKPYYIAGDGAQAADLAVLLLTRVVPDVHKQYALMIGSNDHLTHLKMIRRYPTEQGLFKAFLLQSLVHLLTERSSAISDSVSYTGIWGNAKIEGCNSEVCIGKAATMSSSAATTCVSGTAVYIGYTIQNDAETGTAADVLIDGSRVGSLTSSGNIVTLASAGWAPAAARFEILSPDPVVKVIVTSPNFILNYIAGSDHSAAPKVALSNIIRMTPGGYSEFQSSDEIVDQYNNIIGGLVDDLTKDGFDIRLVDNHSSIDPATDICPDGVHPNDHGHRKIFENFKAAFLYTTANKGAE